MQLFRAALSANLQKVMAQRNPNTLTLDEMYQIAMDTGNQAPRSKRRLLQFIRTKGKTVTRMRRLPASRKGNPPKARIRRKIPTQPKLPTRGLPSDPSTDQDQGTTPTAMENIVSTASCEITHKKIVLSESETKNCAKTNRVMPIGPGCT